MDGTALSARELAQHVTLDTSRDCVLLLRCQGRPMGVIEDGSFRTCDPFYLEVFREWALADLPARPDSERILSERLAAALRADGWSVTLEDTNPHGRVDICAKNADETRIIEVKACCSTAAAAQALGQLLFYAHYHPGASLWMASPSMPCASALDVLRSNGVLWMSLSPDMHRLQGKAPGAESTC